MGREQRECKVLFFKNFSASSAVKILTILKKNLRRET